MSTSNVVVAITRRGLTHATLYVVRQTGTTPDGYDRWIIPVEVLEHDRLEFGPWPPTKPVVVLCDDQAGRIRPMFKFDPLKDKLDIPRLENWSWDAPAVIHPAPPAGPKESTNISELPDVHVQIPVDAAALVDNPNLSSIPMTAGIPLSPYGLTTPTADAQRVFEYLMANMNDPTVIWWLKKAVEEIDTTVEKAREYGSAELEYAGHVMARIGDRKVSAAEAMELQVYHYVLGKLGRWTSAVIRGEQVSDDTLFDIGVYVRMVQRIRDTGEWP